MKNLKLLSEVLGLNIGKLQIKDNEIRIGYDVVESLYGDDYNEKFISIYELADKCEKWALTKGFSIVSYMIDEVNQRALVYRTDKLFEPEYKHMVEPEAYNSKAEAVIRAAEMIWNDLNKV